MAVKNSSKWHVSRMGGVWQWFLLIAGLSLLLSAFVVFGKGQATEIDLPGPTPARPDILALPLGFTLVGFYCLVKALRVRFRWNDEVIQDSSRYFVFREFRWQDLTEIKPTIDGIGRELVFGRKGSLSLTQTGGSGTVPLRDIWALENLAKDKLRENARTS